MKTPSTYSLLAQSEDKVRSIFETAVHALVVLSTVGAIFQFAAHSVIVPAPGAASSTSAPIVAKANVIAADVRG